LFPGDGIFCVDVALMFLYHWRSDLVHVSTLV
jgi:hypothetical protein